MDILYAGAGALAQRCAILRAAPGVSQWALRRSVPDQAAPFDLSLAADLTRLMSLALPAPPTHVLYTATPSARTPDAYQAVYGTGLEQLLAQLDLSRLTRFVFVSSTAVYGSSDEWVNEDSPTEPAGFNGEALLRAEAYLRAQLGDRLVVLRLAGLYGPGRTRILRRLRAGEVTVPDGEGHWVNRLHDEDAARLCAWALDADIPGGIYIGVDDSPMEMSQLYDTLAAWLGVPAPGRDALASPSGKRLSNQRLTSLGFRLKWPSTLEGYRSQL